MKQATDPGGSGPVPIIGITPFTAGEIRRRTDVAEAVRTACEEIGFFVIVGHGFPEGLVSRIYGVSRAFFDLPPEEKNTIGETGPIMGGLMHFGLDKEALAAALGGGAIPDLKETLDFGPGFFGDRWPTCPRSATGFAARHDTCDDATCSGRPTPRCRVVDVLAGAVDPRVALGCECPVGWRNLPGSA